MYKRQVSYIPPGVSEILNLKPSSAFKAADIMIIDTACQKLCMGPEHYEQLRHALEQRRIPIRTRQKFHTFQFGKGSPEMARLQVMVIAGIQQVLGSLLPFLVNAPIPLLGSLSVLISLGAILDTTRSKVYLQISGAVSLRPPGHRHTRPS